MAAVPGQPGRSSGVRHDATSGPRRGAPASGSPLGLGGIGLCGRDVLADGLCGLAPPLTCYTCPSLAAFRDDPHRIVGDSLEELIDTRMDGAADRRIPLQLEDTLAAIRQWRHRSARKPGPTGA